jgi:thiamine biosynthesis lipoprotein
MGTVVTIEVVGHEAEREACVERAIAWFAHVEHACSRFDAASELRRLCDRPGHATRVSPSLFETTRFAIALAGETGGAFDPTMGAYDAVHVDESTHTITLARGVDLDLGAIAKGFAVDMAARELSPLGNYAIDAGGDLYLGGSSAAGAPWSVGIRHPRRDALLRTIRAADIAVCTSGDYERGKHIVDARTNAPPRGVASVTTIAPLAMVADGFGTAVFALGAARGIELLERHGIEGLVVTSELDEVQTRGSRHFADA